MAKALLYPFIVFLWCSGWLSCQGTPEVTLRDLTQDLPPPIWGLVFYEVGFDAPNRVLGLRKVNRFFKGLLCNEACIKPVFEIVRDRLLEQATDPILREACQKYYTPHGPTTPLAMQLTLLTKIQLLITQGWTLPYLFSTHYLNTLEQCENNDGYLRHDELPLVPWQIEKVTRVERLQLSRESVWGPHPDLWKLKNLKRLILNNHAFQNFPDRIFDIKTLEYLDLSFNQLDALPERIGELSALRTLHLNNNKFSTFPKSCLSLTMLTQLGLAYNQVAELPRNIKALKNLQILLLSHNSLTRLPSEIGDLKRLTQLYASHNQIHELPASLGRCPILKGLFLGANCLSDLPEELGHCQRLKAILLDHNNFQMIPACLKNLPWIRKINLEGNAIPSLLIEAWYSTVNKPAEIPIQEKPQKKQKNAAEPKRKFCKIKINLKHQR